MTTDKRPLRISRPIGPRKDPEAIGPRVWDEFDYKEAAEREGLAIRRRFRSATRNHKLNGANKL